MAWLTTQAPSDRVHQSSHAQSNPVNRAGSHSGCTRANMTEVTAAASGVITPDGDLLKILVDQPADQERPPEKLFDQGDENDQSQHPHPDERPAPGAEPRHSTSNPPRLPRNGSAG